MFVGGIKLLAKSPLTWGRKSSRVHFGPLEDTECNYNCSLFPPWLTGLLSNSIIYRLITHISTSCLVTLSSSVGSTLSHAPTSPGSITADRARRKHISNTSLQASPLWSNIRPFSDTCHWSIWSPMDITSLPNNISWDCISPAIIMHSLPDFLWSVLISGH